MPPPAPEHQAPCLVNRFNKLQTTIDTDWNQLIQHVAQQNTLSDTIQTALRIVTSIDHYLSTGIHVSEKPPITFFIDNPTRYDYHRALQEKRTGCLRSAQASMEEYVRLEGIVRDGVAALGRKEADLRALRGRILQAREWELEVMKGRVEALVHKR